MPSSVEHPVAEAALRAFCAAMNTPVVNIEQLETTPARGAIVLYADEYGEESLAIAVRSVSTDQHVIFRYQGDPREFGSAAGALEVALSFAEGMGFLFEEDLIENGGGAGRRRAAKIWAGLTRAAGRDGRDRESAGPDDDALELDSESDDVEELVLTEAVAPSDETDPSVLVDGVSVDLYEAGAYASSRDPDAEAGFSTMTFVGASTDDSGGPMQLTDDDPDEGVVEARSARVLTKFRSGVDVRVDLAEVEVFHDDSGVELAPQRVHGDAGFVDDDAAVEPTRDPDVSSPSPVGRMDLLSRTIASSIHDGSEVLKKLLASF